MDNKNSNNNNKNKKRQQQQQQQQQQQYNTIQEDEHFPDLRLLSTELDIQ